MTIEEMKLRKKVLGLTNEQLAELSGVPLSTVQKVLGGTTASPRYDTLMALEKALKPASDHCVAESTAYYGMASAAEDIAPDGTFNGKHPGEFTIDDYMLLPDEHRVELIDGYFYDMASPVNVHQLITGSIYAFLHNWVKTHGGSCIPFVSPVDVHLDPDDKKTIVQPDVLVVCDRNKLTNHIVGAPDLVIEVLSPSSWRRDLNLKANKYEQAGVREFWAVSPKNQAVTVMNFEKNAITIYSFQSKIPVGIWDDCVLDFNDIWEDISFLY